MILALLLVASLLAFGLSTVSGGGAGLMLVPLLGLVLPVAEVPAALSLGTATSSLSRVVSFRRDIRWDVVRWFVPAALPAAALGVWLLTRFAPMYVEFILGCFLAANLRLVFRGNASTRTSPAERGGKLSPRGLLVLGAVAGFISGFTGAIGLLLNHFYLRCGMSKEQIVATRAANEVLLHMLKLVLYASFGLLGIAAMQAGAIVAVAAVLAVIFVRRLLPLIDEALFRKVAVASMAAAGIAVLFNAGSHIVEHHAVGVNSPKPGELEIEASFGGRRYVFEVGRNGNVVIERSTDIAALPASVRSAVGALAVRADITLVEEVFKSTGKSYEVYLRTREGQSSKLEFTGDT